MLLGCRTKFSHKLGLVLLACIGLGAGDIFLTW